MSQNGCIQNDTDLGTKVFLCFRYKENDISKNSMRNFLSFLKCVAALPS